MFLPISTETTQNRDSGGGVHWSFVLWVGLSIMPAAAQAPAAQAPAAQAPAAQAPAIEQPARPLEPGRPVERELAGGQSHTYQLTLAVGQYAG
ncbi:MAG TPA: hypothetical protein VJ302_02510, partial [Blastocatellia bacterium]|nr:hypothetical protein [Blastocatellia bacterium]